MESIPEDALHELRELYGQLEAEMAPLRRPCLSSGQCCHFTDFDHRLYVTRLEAAEMVRSGEELDLKQAGQGTCPFLRGRLCGIREHRALGCRVFFCDQTLEEERNEIYEKYLDAIRQIEVRHGIAHEYVQITEAWSD